MEGTHLYNFYYYGVEQHAKEAGKFGVGQRRRAFGGKRLTASGAETVQIYALEIQELLTLARSRVTRTPPSLTPEECKRYFQSETCPPLL